MPRAKDQKASACPARETSQLAASSCRGHARNLLVIICILLGVPNEKIEGCRFHDKCSFIHNEDNSQGKKQKKCSKPDKTTTALVKDIEQLGRISQRTVFVEEKQSEVQKPSHHSSLQKSRKIQSDQKTQRSAVGNHSRCV